ncbi:MAG: hypothetical protein EOM67_16995 [Spirochaetia bacterium]|nr:hypothetical protein [Spirochaetia bacterium]
MSSWKEINHYNFKIDLEKYPFGASRVEATFYEKNGRVKCIITTAPAVVGYSLHSVSSKITLEKAMKEALDVTLGRYFTERARLIAPEQFKKTRDTTPADMVRLFADKLYTFVQSLPVDSRGDAQRILYYVTDELIPRKGDLTDLDDYPEIGEKSQRNYKK